MKPTATAALDLLDRTGLTRAVTAPVLTTVGEHLDRRLFADWSSDLERLVDCGGRGALVLDFIRASAACARRFPPEDCVALSRTLCALTEDLGASEMAAITQHLPAAISAVRVDDGVRYYLALLEDIAAEAPGALAVFVERTPMLLTHVRQEGLRAFVRAGLTSERDTEKLHHYFALADKSAWQVIEQEGGEVSLGEIEGRLKSLATVLWKGRPFIRPLPGNSALGGQRRASFDRHMIRLPQSFSGYRASEAEQLYKAAIAHIGAHWAHTPHRVEIKSLKPVQVALVALLEDAKAEVLAGREYPGLLRLWRRFHTAEAAGPALAEPLMARLSRALIDPDYEDDNSWVQKGRKMFFDAEPDWDDPAVLRRIGGLLGNDIGQMRLQFNAKTYVVQPPYRDDNMGILDFGDIPPEMNEDDEEVFDSVQLNQVENPDQPQDREKQESGGDANSQVSSVRPVDSDHGIPIAKLPEWDYATGSTRRDWVTIMEYRPVASRASIIDQVLDRHETEHRRIEALISQARVGRAIRLKRQPEGDSLDLDAAIRAMIDRRAGVEPDTRVYQSSALMHRDLSVLVLLDISESTKDIVTGTHSTVFSAERAATALLAEAMAGLNDPFAIHAFCSDSRKELRYYRIKDFGERYGDDAKSRLAGLRPGLSTRMGAALRQAAHEIGGQLTHRRLVLVVTDGEPSDIDVSDRKYLVEDARKAVHELAHEGINVFAVGLDSEGEGYLSRIFGRRNVAQISNVAALPHKLPMLYLRLTAWTTGEGALGEGLQNSWRDDFRKYLAEVIGTFMLVFFAAGAVMGATLSGAPHGAVIGGAASGIGLMVIIWIFLPVSGAHVNPALSIALAIFGRFPWRLLPGYIIAQLVGSALAAGFLRAGFGSVAAMGANLPAIDAGITPVEALIIETTLSIILMIVILGAFNLRPALAAFAPVPIGAVVGAEVLVFAGLAGGAMNPARAFGPYLFYGDWTHFWIYVVGPIGGMAIGAALFVWLFTDREA